MESLPETRWTRGLPTARTDRPPAAGLAEDAAAHQEVQQQHATQINVTATALTPAFLPREGKAAAAALFSLRGRKGRARRRQDGTRATPHPLPVSGGG